MSLREKIRLNFPLYFVISLLFSVALCSLWLPNWFGSVDKASATPVTTFSTAINVSPRVPSGADVKIAYNAGIYAMVFTSSSVTATSATTTCGYPGSGAGSQSCKLFFTKSDDNGITWSSPTLISSNIFFHGDTATIASFSHDPRRGGWVVLYKEYGNTEDIVQAYSATGASWTVSTVISNNSNDAQHYLGRAAAIAFSTSSDLRAVLAQRGNQLVVGTTSNTGLTTSWPTSTVESFEGWRNTESLSWESSVRPIGISIDNLGVIHAVYAMASTTASFGYQIIYASSTDQGLTWATTSISGVMSAAVASQMTCFECSLNTSDIDPYTGRLSVIYYQTTAYSSDLLGSSILSATSSLKFGQLGANGSWTTSTLSTQIPFYYSYASTEMLSPMPTALTVPYTGMYAAAIFATNSNPYYRVNTTTAISEQIDSTTLFNLSEMSTVYNSTTKDLALAYVDSSTYRVKFATSSLRIAQLNIAATTTAITPVQAQSGTGVVTVSTTVADGNYETVTLYVDYSLDHGTTWTSSTIASATGEGGSLTTAAGRITNITTSADGDQVVSFTWDTSVILAASSTSAVRLRILADDGSSHTGYRQSASFSVDNQAPGVPSELLLSSVGTTSLSFLWTASTGTPTLYFTSSTAATATATSTSATTTNYTNLTPNTQYLFQVKAQDTYSNTSSYATATSTYTDAAAPTAITASNNGSASIVVSWTATNGSGTSYQLYNVTTGAVVATTTNSTYTVTGLTASTAYQFKVRAQYLADNDTYTDFTSDSTAVSTSAASSGNSDGGSAAPSGSPPAAPASAPATAAGTVPLTLNLNTPFSQKVGASEHTFTAEIATAQSLKLKVQSEPMIVNLAVNTPKEVDTNADGILDLRLTYSGLSQGRPQILVTNLTDEAELQNALTIQAGAYETNSRTVVLNLNSAGAVQMALSNTPDFSGANFVSFAKEVKWNLTSGNGQKTVYVKLRSSQGGAITVSDTITLVGQTGGEIVLPSSNETESVVTPPIVSTPALVRTLKRGLTGADVKQLQLELQAQGFLSKSIKANSVFGPATETAVKALEKKRGIKVDGIVDLVTWNSLFVISPVTSPTTSAPSVSDKTVLYSGATGAEVTWVQTKLQTLGYFPKNIQPNGVFGPATKKAVQAFQKAKGILMTGNVGPLTWTALNK